MMTTHIPGSVQSLQDTNSLAFALYRTAAEAVMAHGREHGYPVPTDLFAAYEAALGDLHRSTVALCDASPPVGSTVWTADGHGMLVATASRPSAACHGGLFPDLTSCVTLTSDGGSYIVGDWHDGPEAETVSVERYDADGRTFHGYIDSVSRRLTQSG